MISRFQNLSKDFLPDFVAEWQWFCVVVEVCGHTGIRKVDKKWLKKRSILQLAGYSSFLDISKTVLCEGHYPFNVAHIQAGQKDYSQECHISLRAHQRPNGWWCHWDNRLIVRAAFLPFGKIYFCWVRLFPAIPSGGFW